jgi:hypothetical protein
MKLNDEQKKQVINNPVFKNIKCPVCESTELILTDRIFELREYFGGNLQLRGNVSVIPVVSVMCEKCGYLILLNAVKSGLVKSDKTKTPEEPTEQSK